MLTTIVDDTAMADAVLASALAESATSNVDDELPLITADANIVQMCDSSHSGLQTACAVRSQVYRRRQEEREGLQHPNDSVPAGTAYRDATGRRIDISMHRAEARNLEEKEII